MPPWHGNAFRFTCIFGEHAHRSNITHSIYDALRNTLSVINALFKSVDTGNLFEILWTLQWSHNERHGVSNHQHLDGLLGRLLRRTSKKISKLRVTSLCEGNPSLTSDSPHKGPVARKMLPVDDVIMDTRHESIFYSKLPVHRSVDWLLGYTTKKHKHITLLPRIKRRGLL